MSHSPLDSQSSEQDQHDLVEQAQAGDISAIYTLFISYHRRLHLYLTYMVGNAEVAGELTQETFLKIWEALPGLQNSASFVSWLYRIATNLVGTYQTYMHGSRWWKWPWRGQQQANYPLPSSGSTQSEEQTDQVAMWQDSLRQITLLYRACLVLRIVEDLSSQQIAQLLDISTQHVDTSIKQGLQELRWLYPDLDTFIEELAGDLRAFPEPAANIASPFEPDLKQLAPDNRVYVPSFPSSKSYTRRLKQSSFLRCL